MFLQSWYWWLEMLDLLTSAYGWTVWKTVQVLSRGRLSTVSVFAGFPLYLRSKYIGFHHVVKRLWVFFTTQILQSCWILLWYYMSSIHWDSMLFSFARPPEIIQLFYQMIFSAKQLHTQDKNIERDCHF